MTDRSTVVVSQPLPVVEAVVRDVTGWPGLFGEVAAVTRLASGQYAIELQCGRRTSPGVVCVRWAAAEHRFTWRAVSGRPWSGELQLVALTGRRTAVHLTLNAVPARRGRRAARLRGMLAALGPLWSSADSSSRRDGACRDLATLRRRLDALPPPVRPPRLVPRQGLHPMDDLLTTAGLRAREVTQRHRTRAAAEDPRQS
jgi:hypothetical protein